jgi:transposase
MFHGLTKIYVNWETAPYDCGAPVSDYRKASSVELAFLPSYSPDLNLIERL